MKQRQWIRQWPSQQNEICEEIRSAWAPIKIVLKTKNEEHLLRSWITHHLAIVGDGNIVVMDNGSESPQVFSILDEFKHRLKIFSFLGIHNYLHVVDQFPSLYQALQDSCSHYIFLDTDELLYFKAGDKLVHSGDICASFAQEQDHLFPGMWLPNYPGCDDIYFIDDYPGRIVEGLSWGKPLIPSSLTVSGYVNHNIQLLNGNPNLVASPGLFVGHLTRLLPAQRIRQNVQKLATRKIIKNADEVWELISAGTVFSDENANLYLREIANLRTIDHWDRPGKTPKGCLRISEDGALTFGDTGSQNAFLRLESKFQEYWAEVSKAQNRQ